MFYQNVHYFIFISGADPGFQVIIIIIMLTVICRQNILRTITIKEVLILVTNILDHNEMYIQSST